MREKRKSETHQNPADHGELEDGWHDVEQHGREDEADAAGAAVDRLRESTLQVLSLQSFGYIGYTKLNLFSLTFVYIFNYLSTLYLYYIKNDNNFWQSY